MSFGRSSKIYGPRYARSGIRPTLRVGQGGAFAPIISLHPIVIEMPLARRTVNSRLLG
jgi:hypothetical protein